MANRPSNANTVHVYVGSVTSPEWASTSMLAGYQWHDNCFNAGARASVVARSRVVRCRAVAAPERPATKAKPLKGPTIMNGEVLHSITAERLELVKTLGQSGYMEEKVSRSPTTACWLAMPWQAHDELC